VPTSGAPQQPAMIPDIGCLSQSSRCCMQVVVRAGSHGQACRGAGRWRGAGWHGPANPEWMCRVASPLGKLGYSAAVVTCTGRQPCGSEESGGVNCARWPTEMVRDLIAVTGTPEGEPGSGARAPVSHLATAAYAEATGRQTPGLLRGRGAHRRTLCRAGLSPLLTVAMRCCGLDHSARSSLMAR
jgi:hypothetical protein